MRSLYGMSPQAATSYLRYAPTVEQPLPNEAATFDELSATMQHITRTMAKRYRHAYRPVHAKSHGLLVGTLSIPVQAHPFAQGLFAEAGTYPVIMRFSTNPGDLLADSVSSPRGLAIKILNVQGEMVASHRGNTTQDFVCVNAKSFPVPDPAGFLEQIKLLDKTLELPETVKQAVSTVTRGVNALFSAVGIHNATLDSLGHPYTHILGETYSTIAPLRFGDYIAKIAIVPGSENLKALAGKHVDAGDGYNALEDLIKQFFESNTAIWNIQAQLGLDSELTPIEDASKQWPEDKSPYQTVATLKIDPQDSYSDARQVFVDEQLSFSPWHALEFHRPLGGIMRARLKAYEDAQKFRIERNGRLHVEPQSIDEIPT
jgi:catalase